VHSQIINPYSRIVDPRGLARLNDGISEPLRYATLHGLPKERDLSDSSFIIAQDTGAGIICHIWMTTDSSQESPYLKIYIDGKLVISSSFSSFFKKRHGSIRPPFDTVMLADIGICAMLHIIIER
jgi:hypothetical protein